MADTLNSRSRDEGLTPQRWQGGRYLLVLGLATLLGLFGGALGASGQPALAAIFLGLVIAAIVVSSRVALFWFVVNVALVVTGLVQLYAPWSQARYVRYVAPLAALALLLHWVMDRLRAGTRGHDEPLPAPVTWALAFALASLVSVLINLSDPVVAFIGVKNYFQMWGLFLGVMFLRWNDGFTRNLLRGLLLIALLQLPFAAHQYFFLVPQRVGLGEGIVPVDVVAGTFGASLLGGGANAVLAAFQVIMFGCLLALWKNGAMSTRKAALLSVLLLAPLLVNQAKISALYIPLVVIVVFYRDIAVRPARFLIVSLGAAGVLAVLLTALTIANPSGKLRSWSDLVDQVVARQTADISERRGQYSELSRWGVLTFWAQEHVKASPALTLFGHGLGESRAQERGLNLADTLAEKRYPGLRIGATALSALLWDTGIFGTFTVLGMFLSAFLSANWLARHYRGKDRFRTGLFEGLQAGTAVLALSLAHKDFFVVHIAYQTVVYLLIGFIANSWLQVVRVRRPPPSA